MKYIFSAYTKSETIKGTVLHWSSSQLFEKHTFCSYYLGCYNAMMEYLSQIDHLVEVLKFLLSKIPADYYSDDVELMTYFGNLQRLLSITQIITNPLKEEGELEIDTGEKVVQNIEKDSEKLENDNLSVKESDNPDVPCDEASHMLDKSKSVSDNKNNISHEDIDEEAELKPIKDTNAEQNQLQGRSRGGQLQCLTCGRTFLKQEKLNQHIKSHKMGDPALICEKCNKAFFCEPELKKHVHEMHTYVYCHMCEYKATKQLGLKAHIRSKHTKERPYTCGTCGKGFITHQHLSRHMELHESVKKHECSVCGKKFSASRHLSTHSRIHSKSFSGQCNICDKKFVQKYNMTLHMRKHHPESCR